MEYPCIDCAVAPATDDFNERCAKCQAAYEANLTPDDCPPDWFAGGFAENH